MRIGVQAQWLKSMWRCVHMFEESVIVLNFDEVLSGLCNLEIREGF